MALTYSEKIPLGAPAPEFALPGVDGRIWRLADFTGSKALVVIFMCNHCPYVKAVQGRINTIARKYAAKGVALVGINSNDATRYPDDSFEAMKQVMREKGYVFPYLFDETQDVARAYDAVCTPDIYVFSPKGTDYLLAYHGRIDDNWKDEAAVTRRDLEDALEAILAGGAPAAEQIPSMGCSIKWK